MVLYVVFAHEDWWICMLDEYAWQKFVMYFEHSPWTAAMPAHTRQLFKVNSCRMWLPTSEMFPTHIQVPRQSSLDALDPSSLMMMKVLTWVAQSALLKAQEWPWTVLCSQGQLLASPIGGFAMAWRMSPQRELWQSTRKGTTLVWLQMWMGWTPRPAWCSVSVCCSHS